VDKTGSWNIRHGLLWLVGGAVLTWATFTYLGSNYSIVFWGAIAYGAGQLVVGLWRRARTTLLPPGKTSAAHTQADWTTLLRCMAMVANADGVADESEIEAIHQIYEEIAGDPPRDGQVRKMVEEVATGGDSPDDFVASLGQAPPPVRLLIGRACWLVVNAGEGASPPEEEMFDTILKALEIPRAAVVGTPDLTAAPQERPE
jgi:hypothetical protein